MGDYPKKEIVFIEEEIRRINKEEERRLAELKSKRAGGEIENFERRRKRKITESIIGRIKMNMAGFRALFNMIEEKKDMSAKEKEDFIRKIARDYFNTYKSIKKDLSYTFKEGG